MRAKSFPATRSVRRCVLHALPVLLFTGALLPAVSRGENRPATALTAEWEAQIRGIAPDKGMAEPKKTRKILLFSLNTGFRHEVIPHTAAVVKILGEKSGAFSTVADDDIEVFRPANLKPFDAVVLNNNCPLPKDRDIFRDVLINKADEFGAKYKDRPLEKREALAKELLSGLIDYVSAGGGLIVLHGAIANFNFSDEFSEVAGGSFHFHPPSQEVILNLVDPGHPLLKPFGGKPFVHRDEPYLFNRAYEKMNFHPLLQFDLSNMDKAKRIDEIRALPRYSAWIKRHREGRVFYCSPSHYAESFENPALLQFLLGGIQYALGDLQCPDEPVSDSKK